MKSIRIEALKLDVKDPFIENQQALTHFEWERTDDFHTLFYLDAYMGKDRQQYCFHLRINFCITLDTFIKDEDELLDQCVQLILEPLMSMIVLLERYIHADGESS